MIGKIIWIYGMSGAGKTTLATKLATELGYLLVDGDIVRNLLGASDDFSPKGRRKHQDELRSKLNFMSLDGKNIVVASITPYDDMRKLNRLTFKSDYYEVYLKCSLDVLTSRDPKGLYVRALKGEIKHFTGVSDRFDSGEPDLTIETGELDEEESYKLLLEGVTKWIQS